MSKRPLPKFLTHQVPISVKRLPAKKRPLKRLFTAIRGRNQRAATATASDMEAEDSGLRISRGFFIIIAFHVVATILFFVHRNFLNDRTSPPPNVTVSASAAEASKPRTQSGIPLISPDDKTCKVQAGDTYERIATREGVQVDDLRKANGNCSLAADLTLILPQKRHSAGYPPAIEALRNPPKATAVGSELVDAVPADSKGIVVRPKVVRETINSPRATPSASGRSYVVKNGDNLWQIALRFKVDQAALMRANRIADPKKLKPGTTLAIPQ